MPEPQRNKSCPEYGIWWRMVRRCTSPDNKDWDDYGGRGVIVCERWLDPGGFERFYGDFCPRPSPELSIDRVDVNGNYELGNVRWATVKEQQRNKRNNRRLTFNGITKTMVEWSEHTGLTFGAIEQRLDKLGWTVERALTFPLRKTKSGRREVLLTHDGRTQNVSAWANEVGIRPQTLYKRITDGWAASVAIMTPVVPGTHAPPLGISRVASPKRVATPRRIGRLVTAQGKTMTQAEWDRHLGLPRKTVAMRLNRGWQPDDAVSLPLGSARPGLVLGGAMYRKSNLTDANVLDIGERAASGVANTHLAAEFGVASSSIDRIVRRLTWRHV